MLFGSKMSFCAVNIKQLVSRLAVFLCDAIFPLECLACGANGEWICGSCSEGMAWQVEQFCPLCREASELGVCCQGCKKYLDGVLVMAHYQGLMKRAIIACKYNFASSVGLELGELAADFFANQVWTDESAIIVPVPLARRRFNWRGFNQTELIAHSIAEGNCLQINTTELIKERETEAQAKLIWEERLSLTSDCFAWRGDSLVGKTLIVVDDVMTTGTTLESVARVLKKAGARRVWGLVLARGD